MVLGEAVVDITAAGTAARRVPRRRILIHVRAEGMGKERRISSVYHLNPIYLHVLTDRSCGIS